MDDTLKLAEFIQRELPVRIPGERYERLITGTEQDRPRCKIQDPEITKFREI